MTVLTLDEKQLRDYLGCYGSDILGWPPALQNIGVLAMRYPEFAALIEQEKRFEQLLAERIYDEPSAGFAERIIAQAHSVPQSPMTRSFWLEPAAIAAVLVLGFTIGFGTSAIPTLAFSKNIPQSVMYADDESTAL